MSKENVFKVIGNAYNRKELKMNNKAALKPITKYITASSVSEAKNKFKSTYAHYECVKVISCVKEGEIDSKDNSSSLGGMLFGGVATAVGGYFLSKILDKNKEKES